MKIHAGAVGRTDLEDKSEDVDKDPGNKEPSKKDVIIDMGVRAASDGHKSSKLVQEKTTNQANQLIRPSKFEWGLLIIMILNGVVCSTIQYFRWRSEQAL